MHATSGTGPWRAPGAAPQAAATTASWTQTAPARTPGETWHGQDPVPPAAPLDQAQGSAASPSGTLGAFADILVRCKVSWVLMLVLLQPSPTKLLPKHAQTLEKYSWEAFDGHGQDSSSQLPEELFLLLQSLVMAAHEKDTESIKKLQVEMWPLLTAEGMRMVSLFSFGNHNSPEVKSIFHQDSRCAVMVGNEHAKMAPFPKQEDSIKHVHPSSHAGGGFNWRLLCLASLDHMTWVEASIGNDDLVPRVVIRSVVAATSGEQRDSVVWTSPED
ncbi:40-kDa huntingtin-associated protein [Lemmus lemmus]